MKKYVGRITIVCVLTTLMLALTGCCSHEFCPATCEEPPKCVHCGKIKGSAKGHFFTGSEEGKMFCEFCGAMKGACSSEHTWQEATCETPKTCKICTFTEGEALGHKFEDATCTQPATCSVCGEESGTSLGHDFFEATLTTPKTCKICGETSGSVLPLSSTCDEVLVTGKERNGDSYEVVINRIDAYPDTTYEVGIIKNNKWLIEMSSSSPFFEGNGRWKGSNDDNEKGAVKYIGTGLFYYAHPDSAIAVLYKPETNVSFDVINMTTLSVYKDNNSQLYSRLVNYNGEALAVLADNDNALSYLNMNTGESKSIPLPFEFYSLYKVGNLSDGLFYCKAMGFVSGVAVEDGFFDLNGNRVIDLKEYKINDYGDYMFRDGKYTFKCKNTSNVVFEMTMDTSGNILSQKKVDE